ncbi:MAG: TonB-dependent receptor [Sphingomonadales bacterium]|nr:TonB-dependent receptor [Sphingomonadales bacterium]
MKFTTASSRFALAAAMLAGTTGVVQAQAAQETTPSTTSTSTPPVDNAAPGAAAQSYPNGQSSANVAPGRAAQSREADNLNGEIIVTARKRDETLISVPVVVTAIGGRELAARGITNIDGLARVTPQLLAGNQGGAVQGGNITIRGVSGPDQNPFGDQAVSFNIDGVQVAKATVRRMSDFDIGQIEVLKGPQALFFGKNSPAGIISISTADPTRVFEAKVSAGYEFNARQVRTEGYVSGPLSDTLGFRLAGVYSDMKGDLKDLTPIGSPYAPNNDRNPSYKDWALRGTLKWNPSSEFDAKLKVSYGQLHGDGPASGTAFTSCPQGARFTGSGINQCNTNDGANSNAGYGKFLAGLGGTLNHFRADGNNFNKQNQLLSGLEMNWHPTDAITLTSVTGYYKVTVDQCQNYENDSAILLPSCNIYSDKEFSQEFRFSTDYEGPVNFTGGVYYSDVRAATGSITYLFGGAGSVLNPADPTFYGSPTNPALINNYFLKQHGNAYSAYAQISYKPVEKVEINIGGRYSYEKKKLTSVRFTPGLSDGAFSGSYLLDNYTLDASTEVSDVILPRANRSDSWKDFSPEITVSYRPSQHLTVFASYKHGFLSGGYNAGSVSFGTPAGCTAARPDLCLKLSYDPQTIKGFEGGIKAELFDNTLRTNLSAYTYSINDQQVSNVINATNTISNAGGAKVQGVEYDFNYRTPLQGLSVNGAASYNKGKYTSYPTAPCYGGQTAANGCVGGLQDLGGTELIRAPKWNLSSGFNFETPVGDSVKFAVNGNVAYVSSYLTDSSSAPNGRQPSYTLFDATARIAGADDRWELALIGRNLTDKYYIVASSLVPFAAGPPGALLDRFSTLSRGREIMLRASFKFGG